MRATILADVFRYLLMCSNIVLSATIMKISDPQKLQSDLLTVWAVLTQQTLVQTVFTWLHFCAQKNK